MSADMVKDKKLTITNPENLIGHSIGLYKVDGYDVTDDKYQFTCSSDPVFNYNRSLVISIFRNVIQWDSGELYSLRLSYVVDRDGVWSMMEKEINISPNILRNMFEWVGWVNGHLKDKIGWKMRTW